MSVRNVCVFVRVLWVPVLPQIWWRRWISGGTECAGNCPRGCLHCRSSRRSCSLLLQTASGRRPDKYRAGQNCLIAHVFSLVVTRVANWRLSKVHFSCSLLQGLLQLVNSCQNIWQLFHVLTQPVLEPAAPGLRGCGTSPVLPEKSAVCNNSLLKPGFWNQRCAKILESKMDYSKSLSMSATHNFHV